MRVRFCPSPSGTAGIHLGNAKTALFNFLFARKYNADYVFRIEDTDQSRVVKGCVENILADLQWLGIPPNMGFGTNNKPAGAYTQMERLDSYRKIAHQLVEQGLAYKCYCSQEELDKRREEALAKNPKHPFKYPGTCRDLKQDLDKPYVIRFRAPTEGYTEFSDITFGKRSVPNKENYDFVLLRHNGIPLYNFAVVIDDAITDHITHVIRGSDHVKNQVSQLLLYQTLKLPLPVYCHLPMLLNKNGAKLSKRDGSVSVADYRAHGYSPDAILNYLVRFGWASGNQEIFSLDEMIEKFTLEACHAKDGKFDPTKFLTVNTEHLKSETLTPTATYAKLLKPFIDAKDIGNFSEETLVAFIPVVRSRAKTFIEAADLLEPMLKVDIQPDQELYQRTITPQTKEYLQAINQILTTIDPWNEATLRANIQTWLTEKNLGLKDIGASLRTSLLGTASSPEIFQVLHAMGKEKSLKRISNILR